MSLSVVTGGSGQLYGGAGSAPLGVATNTQQAVAPNSNFIYPNTVNPTLGNFTLGGSSATTQQTAPANNNTVAPPAAATQASDPSTAAYYHDTAAQLQGQLGQLDGQQNIGLQNIGNSYNQSYNRLDQQNAVAKRNYDMSVQQNGQQYANNRNSIMTNTRATNNTLMRLLGMNGAGNSSAAYEQAPYAAALQGSQNLVQAQQTYGNNGRSIDTNWGDTQRSYKNSVEDLNTQKYQQENSLKSSIAQTRANLLNQIAGAGTQEALANGQSYAQAQAARNPYQQQINDLLSSITNLGQQYANPVMRTADLSYAAPELSQYSLQGGAAPSVQGGASADIQPAFLGILQGQRDQFGNLIQ